MNRQHLKDQVYMEMAETLAKLSTCPRASVGALIVRHRILAGGFNGSPPGFAHCGCKMVEGHCVNAEHAEMNAIIHAKVDLTGATLYVTHHPCVRCARAIASAGIVRVVYRESYRVCDLAKEFLQNVEVVKL